MSEALTALLEETDRAGVRVRASVQPENRASLRVLADLRVHPAARVDRGRRAGDGSPSLGLTGHPTYSQGMPHFRPSTGARAACLEEFDRIGADEFLSRYGFDPAANTSWCTNCTRTTPGRSRRRTSVRRELAPTEDFAGGPEAPPRSSRTRLRRDSSEPTTPTKAWTPPTWVRRPPGAWATPAERCCWRQRRRYHAVITSKELAAAVMSRSEIHTARPIALLDRGRARTGLGRLCRARRATALVAVRQRRRQRRRGLRQGVRGRARGSLDGDADDHAARERLECYRTSAPTSRRAAASGRSPRG